MKASPARSADLVERLRAALSDQVVSEQRMFGGVCFMLNGNMVAGTLRNELLVRVGKENNEAALGRPHARQMEMRRPAPGYVVVASEGTARDADLKRWVDLAVAYVTTLPVKTKKEPAGKSVANKRRATT